MTHPGYCQSRHRGHMFREPARGLDGHTTRKARSLRRYRWAARYCGRKLCAVADLNLNLDRSDLGQ